MGVEEGLECPVGWYVQAAGIRDTFPEVPGRGFWGSGVGVNSRATGLRIDGLVGRLGLRLPPRLYHSPSGTRVGGRVGRRCGCEADKGCSGWGGERRKHVVGEAVRR